MSLFGAESYIDPDDLFYICKEAIPFIYSYDHQLFLGHPGTTHKDLTHGLNFNRKKYGANRIILIEKNLVGRFANHYYKKVLLIPDGKKSRNFDQKSSDHDDEVDGRSVISFWNVISNTYTKLLNPCLKALLNKNLIYNNTIVSTPAGNDRVEDLLSNLDYKSISDVKRRAVEKAQQLHLMGIEKNQVLKDRGIKPRTPIGVTMGLQPGQKHWSMYGDHNLNFKEYYDGLS